MLLLSPKASVSPGGCIIETETGIVNAQLDVQLAALEQAFSAILKHKTLRTLLQQISLKARKTRYWILCD